MLTAFNQRISGVNGVFCRYKALTAINLKKTTVTAFFVDTKESTASNGKIISALPAFFRRYKGINCV